MKKFDSLRWEPRWVSHLGCIKGCLNFLNRPISDAWLYGVTGHAFVLNICGDLCPSGPTDWDTRMFRQLGKNAGYVLDNVSGWKGNQDLAQLQEQAWQHVKNSLDKDLPCYGWELDIPEFFVIYGYDDDGYYISGPGCDNGKGPMLWQRLGTSEIGVVDVSSVRLTQPPDDRKAVRDALSYALEHGLEPKKYTDPQCFGGLQGYDAWIRSVEKGRAAAFGLAYNTAVWTECRKFAVAFLREVREQLDDANLNPYFDKATALFETVSQNLDSVRQAYPFDPELTMAPVLLTGRSQSAALALRRAKDAEAAGFEIFTDIVTQL
ncbi:MAG: hypothetical protein JSV17_10425 [Candidatus Aminicenantes bacterium]|nr:MAG: hypothetical protein JSV17_10425 [Candidatus Aminicenantes bacterium]